MRVVGVDVDALRLVSQGDRPLTGHLKARQVTVREANDQVKVVQRAIRFKLVRQLNVGCLSEGNHLRRGQRKGVNADVMNVKDGLEAVSFSVGRFQLKNDKLFDLKSAKKVVHGEAVSRRCQARRTDVDAGEKAR